MISKRLAKKLVKYDLFPKFDARVREASDAGGILSLLIFSIMFYLTLTEFLEWRKIHHKHEFLVDQTRSGEHSFQLNVDITVAMECRFLRADIFDSSKQIIETDSLKKDPATFTSAGAVDLSVQMKKAAFRDSPFEKRDLSFLEVMNPQIPERKDNATGCRIYGTFNANKLSGTFHITALGHGYFGAHTPHELMNFTHRIDELSFGRKYPGLVNPLDHTFELGRSHFDSFKYFIGIVPTIYVDEARSLFYSKTLLTNQYSVTEYFHQIDESKPDAIPGVYMRFDIEPITVRVTDYRQSGVLFFTRVCGVVGGLFTTVGILLNLYNKVRSMFTRPTTL